MHKLLGGALLCATLTGCAGMNSDFDCNKTATDQCLSMSEATNLAAKGRSLDDLTAEATRAPKKSAAESLAVPANVRPVISPSRPISPATLAPRPLAVNTARSGVLTVSPTMRPGAVSLPVTPADYASAGHVNAERLPDVTRRLWIAPWVDEQDSFHQPAVVEFVKQKSRWSEDFRVISTGE